MKNFIQISLLVALLFCSRFSVLAQAPDIPPLQAELVSDSARVSSHSRVQVGLYITVPNGWHIYWKYPGEAGLAPKISFESTQEVSFEEHRWPVPKEFEQGPNIQGYGYENQVLFPTVVHIGDLGAESLEVAVNAFFLKCSPKLCVPEQISKKLILPVGMKQDSPTNDLFVKWEERMPELLLSEDVRVLFPEPNHLTFILPSTFLDRSVKTLITQDVGFEFRRETKDRESIVFSFERTADATVKRKETDFLFIQNYGQSNQVAVEIRVPTEQLLKNHKKR